MRFPFPCFLAAISVAVASSKEEDAVVSRTLKFSKKHPPPPGPQRPTPSPNTQQWTCARCMEDPQHGCMSKDSGCSACPACVNVQTRCQDLNGEKNVSQVSNIQSYIMMCVNLTMVNETAYYIGDRLYTQFKNETYAIVDKYKSQSTSPFDKDKELLLIQQTYKELFDYTYNMQNVLGDFTSLFEESGEAKHLTHTVVWKPGTRDFGAPLIKISFFGPLCSSWKIIINFDVLGGSNRWVLTNWQPLTDYTSFAGCQL